MTPVLSNGSGWYPAHQTVRLQVSEAAQNTLLTSAIPVVPTAQPLDDEELLPTDLNDGDFAPLPDEDGDDVALTDEGEDITDGDLLA